MRKQKSVLIQTLVFTVFMVVLIAFVYNFNIPNPNMILIAALVLSTSIGGTIPGVVCAVLMFAYSLFFFSTDHSFFQFTETNLHKMIVITLGILINFFSVAILKKSRDRADAQLEEANAKLKETNDRLESANEELQRINEILKSVASMDSLTNLRNRYSLRQDFDMYVGIPLYILFIDLDNFKDMNDNKGHIYGDRILAVVGKALTDCFRTSNCYRYGGDEFLVITENGTEAELRESYRQTKEQLDAAGISFSGGYVYGTAESAPDLRNMIMQADEMLYDVKKDSKDRIKGHEYDHKHVPSQEAVEHYRNLHNDHA